MNGGHVRHRGLLQGVQPRDDAAGPELRGEVQVDVVRVVRRRDAVVGGDDVARLRVARAGQLLEGDGAPPLELAGPAGHRKPGVGHGPQGDAPSGEVAYLPLDVGEEEVVAGVHPGPHGLLESVGVRRPEHGQERLGAVVGAVRGRVAEGDAVALSRVARDDRAVARHRDVELHRVPAAHLDALVAHLRRLPPVGRFVAGGVPFLEALHVQVLVVGHGVGDAPCYRRVVPEVGEPGDAGEGEPHHVELGAGDVVLVVDVGGVQRPVRVSRQQRLPRGRAASRQHPVVAPGVRHVHPVDRLQALAQLLQGVRAGALVHAAGRDDDQVAGLVAG